MRYVSLFSGVEAATVAWSHLGWQPIAFAEVDEFPSAVLAYRFPNVPNLGDVCNIDWEEFHGKYGAVDVLIGGSPCQSFSIAGGRAGLEGESRLMFEYIRAIRDLVRASGGASPRYIVWENVPGCLSSNKGRDFGCLLDALEDCGYFICWRTLDSQFARVFDRSSGRFAGPVPQRRRRVFLVGSLGGPSAADILFERTSLRGDHPSSREAREALAEHAEVGAGMGYSAGFKFHQGAEAGNIGYELEQSPTLIADYHNPAVLTLWDVQSKRVNTPSGTSPTLCNNDGRGIMHNQPIVLQSDGTSSNGAQNGCGYSEDGAAYTLNGRDKQCIALQSDGGTSKTAHGGGYNDDGSAYTVNGVDKQAVCIQDSAAGADYANQCGGGATTEFRSPSTAPTGTPSRSPRTSGARSDWRVFDGSHVGALASSPDFGKGQGGSLICIQDGQAKGTILEDGTCSTLNAMHEQPIVIDRAAFNQGENAKYPPHIEQTDVMDPLVARGPHAVCHRTGSRS